MPASAASAPDSAAQTSRVEMRAARAFGGDQRARDGPHATVESQLAEGGYAVEGVRRQLMRGRKHRQGDRQVEARAFLAQAGRSEIDGDAPDGKDELAEVIPLRTRSFASWQARSARPTIANDGPSELQVSLDLDPAWIEADERVGDRAGEHVATLGDEDVTCLCRDETCCGTEHARQRLHSRSRGRRARLRSTRPRAGRCAGSHAAGSAGRAEPGPLEDLRIELAAVVDDDHDRRPRGASAAAHDARTAEIPSVYALERRPRRAARGGADLALAPVVEPEQLVRVAVLLVVVDQARIRRRGDDGVERAGRSRARARRRAARSRARRPRTRANSFSRASVSSA